MSNRNSEVWPTFFTCAGVEIRLICVTGHVWCWWKSHCSSPVATKGFGGTVSPQFDPAFIGSSHHFSHKEVPDLQKPFHTYLIFFSKNWVIYCHLFPNTLKSKEEEGWHFSKASIPRGYSMSSHTNPL